VSIGNRSERGNIESFSTTLGNAMRSELLFILTNVKNGCVERILSCSVLKNPELSLRGAVFAAW